MKKILVIGGTRFFGIHLVRALIKEGYKITIATRGLTLDNFGNKVERIVFDRYDEKSIIKNLCTSNFDIVYDNLAYSSNDVEILLKNIKCKKYIVISSTSVYNPLKGNVKENLFDANSFEYINCKRDKNNYAFGKRLVEAAVFQKYHSINSVCVRFPFVIGSDDYTERLYAYIKKYIVKEKMNIDNLYNQMSFISSSEAGNFLAFLAKQEFFTGSINAASNGTISIYQILQKIPNVTKEGILKLLNTDSVFSMPYNGIDQYEINTLIAQGLGYEFSNINNWIDELVDYYVSKIN